MAALRRVKTPVTMASEALDFSRLIRSGETVGWAEATAEPVFLTRLLDAQAAVSLPPLAPESTSRRSSPRTRQLLQAASPSLPARSQQTQRQASVFLVCRRFGVRF